jgi:catechol 2,3-dioxygenase-like lactoylglutathione lyase family enzyme
MSRFLAVANTARSLAFYRDVLGFDVRSVREEDGIAVDVEVDCGPAKIQLGVAETACDSTGHSRPRGSAILFLQTDDVAAMREALIARGGHPSEIEKVNWIKMKMFEIRDPDGHALWFGQSFQQPSTAPDHKKQLRKALPELPVDDVPAAVAYYRDVLGFRVNYAQHDLGVMDRDAVTVLLIARTAQHTGIGSCYVYIRDADALHAELLAKGANVQGEPVSYPWGLRDFEVLDQAGNRLRFSQTFE